MSYQTVLFDFDHTLFDSDASELAAFNHTLAAFGVEDPMAWFETYRTINAKLWGQVESGDLRPEQVGVQRFAAMADLAKIDAEAADMATVYAKAMGANGELYPGARDLLETLAATVTLGLVTNAIAAVQRPRIERLGIGELFTAIVISSEVGVSKPNPAIFDHAFSALPNADPATTLMVGDSLSSDIRGGTNAGLDTCWYNPHGASAPATAAPTYEAATLALIAPVVAGDGAAKV